LKPIYLIITLLLLLIPATAAGSVAVTLQPHIHDTLGAPITGWSLDISGDLLAVTTASELYIYRYPGGLQWAQAIPGILPDTVAITDAGDTVTLIQDDAGTLKILSSPISSWSSISSTLPYTDHYEIDRTTATIATWNSTAGETAYFNGTTIRSFELTDVFPADNWTAPGNISSARYRGGIFWASPGDGDISIYRPSDNTVTERSGGLSPTHTGTGNKPMILDQSGSIAWIWGGDSRPFALQYYPLRIASDGTATYITTLVTKPPTLPWSVSWSGTYTAFGDGATVNIWDSSSLQGTFSTGGTISDIIISPNGLYAYATSQDGSLYIFSRVESDSWYLAGTLPHTGSPSDLQVSLAGTKIGWTDGSSIYTYRSEVSQTPVQATILITKNGIPQPGAVISINTGGTGDTGWTEINRPTADSTGRIPITITPGTTYRLEYGSETMTLTAQAGKTDYTWNIWSAPGAASYFFGSAYIDDTIYVGFADWDQDIALIDISIKDMNGVEINSSSIEDWAASSTYPDIDPGTYRIDIATYSDTGGDEPKFRTSQILTKSGASGIAELPISSELMQFLMLMLLLTIAGAFSYLAGPHGALATAVAGLGFWALGWININPLILGAAVVVAGIGVLVRGARDL